VLIDLVAERLNRGLSVRQAAQQIGVTPQTLTRAEERIFNPHPNNALKIATFYGYRVTDVWPLEPNAEEVA
jgi:DNA-binding XRE family transcriptional regulator